MRFKNLLGLLAIGGAVAYAQKKRGGDLSFNGIKNSLRGVVDNVKGKLGDLQQQAGAGGMNRQNRNASGQYGYAAGSEIGGTSSNVGTSNLGSVGGQDDIAGSTGYSQSGSFGSDGMGTGIGNGLGDSGRGIRGNNR